MPFSVVGAAIVSIGSGLISTYTPRISTGKLIGYQIILGAGRGLGMQMVFNAFISFFEPHLDIWVQQQLFRISADITCKPILSVQTFLPRPQIAIGTAFIMLGHTFGGAFSLSIAQTIFSNILRTELQHYAPEVNTQSIISAGAAAIRKVVSADSLPGVLKAYSVAVNNVFYFTAAAGVCSFVFSGGLGWTDVRKKELNESPLATNMPCDLKRRTRHERSRPRGNDSPNSSVTTWVKCRRSVSQPDPGRGTTFSRLQKPKYWLIRP